MTTCLNINRMAFAFVLVLLTGTVMATDTSPTPRPLPYTLRELALALPAPMPTTKAVVEAFLPIPLRVLPGNGSLRSYDVEGPLITRDGYVIDRVDVGEALPGSDYWRTDGKTFFGISLRFGGTACVPAKVIREALDLPSDLREALLRVGPDYDDLPLTRDTSWGGFGLAVRRGHPECATSLGNLANDPKEP